MEGLEYLVYSRSSQTKKENIKILISAMKCLIVNVLNFKILFFYSRVTGNVFM